MDGGDGTDAGLVLVGLLGEKLVDVIVKVDVGVLAELLQVGQHLPGIGIAVVRVGGHGFHGDLLQSLGDGGVDLPRREGDGIDVLDGHGHGGVPLKGQPPGDHLIQHHAGGVQIAAGIDVATPGLLRGDIVDGAQGLLGQGAVSAGGHPGDAKVGHLHAAVPQHHHVVGLDVPVDDAPAVGVAQGLHDLGDEVQGLTPVQLTPLFLHILFQGDPVDELHDDVLNVSGAADIIHRHDVGVRQHGHGLGLVVEAAAELGVLGQVLPQDLHRHQPVQPVAPGFIHLGHPAGADELQDLISVIE